MPTTSPPSDLTATEKRSYRKLVAKLTRAGIDVVARADLLAGYVRAETRLAALREAEGAAEPARRFQAARAVNGAMMEQRRLRAAVWQGARQPDRKPTISERAAEIATDEGREAWRDRHHNRAHTNLSRAEMEARYGRGDIATVLYATAEEEAAALAYLERRARRSPPPRFEDVEEDDDGRAVD